MRTERIESLVDDRPGDKIFRVHRDVFADPELFELEMKHVFGKTWCFLGAESQVSKPHEYITSWIGRTPVLVTRDAKGVLGAFLNICPHKGTQLAHTEHGVAKYHVCAYHGWGFDSSGKNVDIKDLEKGLYPKSFDAYSHDLIPIAKVASYCGLVFGSLSDEVPPLEEYLGDIRPFIDMAMKQSPKGMEVIPGRVRYTYRANWKMQMDNAMDAYHLTTVHASYMDVMSKRSRGEGLADDRSYDWKKRLTQLGGMFDFPHGHSLIWNNQAEVQKRPVYATIDEVRARLGPLQADWMLKSKIAMIFPNFQIADATTLNLRTFRPISVGLTEMRVHCIAPIGEEIGARRHRLRQFEDFFSASGFATPDDIACFESVQRGYAAEPYDYLQGYFRGFDSVEKGANDMATELGIRPLHSQVGDFELTTEATMHAPYREWVRLMRDGVAKSGGAK